ncbi:hypothetical protein D7V86_03015 [bacterium D16-51]|nr:hypothetical protein D7V96_02635 [bacterium D16-59]RKI62097.1 hypothetical protein D7V86_03015 [bacterium D16-51]
MENTVFILLFVGGFLVFLGSMGVDVIRLVLNFLARCLLGLVVIYIANYLLEYFGGNFVVNINEITIGVSGALGIWGVILLYALQYYFTIT